jgi:hypothetical protein
MNPFQYAANVIGSSVGMTNATGLNALQHPFQPLGWAPYGVAVFNATETNVNAKPLTLLKLS